MAFLVTEEINGTGQDRRRGVNKQEQTQQKRNRGRSDNLMSTVRNNGFGIRGISAHLYGPFTSVDWVNAKSPPDSRPKRQGLLRDRSWDLNPETEMCDSGSP